MQDMLKSVLAISLILTFVFLSAAPAGAVPVISFESPRQQVVSPGETLNLSFTSNIPVTTVTYYQDGVSLGNSANKYKVFQFSDGGEYHNISAVADGSNMLTWRVTVKRAMANHSIETFPEEDYNELLVESGGLLGDESNTTPYQYMEISINGNPDISGYQASVTIPYKTGMSADFANIRFYDRDVNIPYWIESKTDGVSALCWVKIDADTDLEVRWSITGETASESDGASVFELFDDFNGPYLNTTMWTLGGNGGNTTSGGVLTLTKAGDPYGRYINSVQSFGVDRSLIVVSSVSSSSQNAAWGFETFGTQNGQMYYVGYPTSSTFNILARITATTSAAIGTGYTGYKRFEVVRNGNTSALFFVNNSFVGTIASNIYTGNEAVVCFAQTQTLSIDKVFVRKYAGPGPTLNTGTVQTWEASTGDWEGVLDISTRPYTDLIGKMFWLALFLLPFAIMWRKQESMNVPIVVGMIVGSLLIEFLPETYKTFIILMIVVSFAVNFYILSKDRV